MTPEARADLARLRAALHYPDQPSVPDVSAIIARGRRARTRRRLLTAGASAAVAAAVVVTVVVATSALSGPPELPVAAPDRAALAALPGGPAPGVLIASGAPQDRAPDEFDPLARTLHIGWVPDGLAGGSVTTGRHEQHYGAFDDAYVNGGPDIGLVVTVLTRGRNTDELPTGALGLPRDARPRPTEPIAGRDAECLSDPLVPAGTCSALRWQYAEDAWAQVSYAGSAGPTPAAAAAVARRVAESVSVSAAEPVRLPFTLSGRLAGLHPVRTTVGVTEDVHPISGTRWSVNLDLTADPDADPTGTVADVRLVCSWTPGGGTPGSDKYGDPNTTVDGHRAVLAPDGGDLTVWDVHGTTVAIFGADPVAAFDDLTVVDDPLDPAGWPPVR